MTRMRIGFAAAHKAVYTYKKNLLGDIFVHGVKTVGDVSPVDTAGRHIARPGGLVAAERLVGS